MSSCAGPVPFAPLPSASLVDAPLASVSNVAVSHRHSPHPAVEVDGLEKHYGQVRALDGISFSVDEGEIFGLLGHNGAGKTTTIRILTGRARPTGGGGRGSPATTSWLPCSRSDR